MPKNPKLENAKRQADLTRDRLKTIEPGSAEAKRLAREVAKLDRLIDLYQEQERRAEKLADMEAKQAEQNRKDETRLKVIVGAAVLSDVGLKPETRAGLVALLDRAIKAPRDREFLKAKGWL